MDRNELSIGLDLLFGMTGRKFSANTIDAIMNFLDSLTKEKFKVERKKLLTLLESGATEQEMLEAVNLSTKDV